MANTVDCDVAWAAAISARNDLALAVSCLASSSASGDLLGDFDALGLDKPVIGLTSENPSKAM